MHKQLFKRRSLFSLRYASWNEVQLSTTEPVGTVNHVVMNKAILNPRAPITPFITAPPSRRVSWSDMTGTGHLVSDLANELLQVIADNPDSGDTHECDHLRGCKDLSRSQSWQSVSGHLVGTSPGQSEASIMGMDQSETRAMCDVRPGVPISVS